MALFQSVTPVLPLSFIPVELSFFERKLVQGLYVGFGSRPMFFDFLVEEASFFLKLLLETAHLHLPAGQHLLLLL